MKTVTPYLNFPGNTEEAFRFYQTVLGGELQIVRFRDFDRNEMDVPDEDLDKVANIGLVLDGHVVLMATDTLESLGQELEPGNNFSITLEAETAEEAEALFEGLSDDGQVLMPLGETEWAERYGMCRDRFGIRWMVNHTGEKKFSP